MSQQPLFHYREIWHSWWRVPVWMTFWTFFILTLMALPITRSSSPYSRPSLLQMLTPTAAIAGVIGFIGLLCGRWYTSRAQAKAAEVFGPNTLPCDHWLSQRVAFLAERLSLPPPAVGAMTTCNAYAVGNNPDSAAVVLGLPLIQALSTEELNAVIGHELGHIASGDMQKMQMAVGFQSLFQHIANTVGEIVARALYNLVAQHSRSSMDRQLAHVVGQLFMAVSNVTVSVGSNLFLCNLSRNREFFADAVGAALTSPEAMQRALIRIHSLGDGQSEAEKSHDVLMFRGGWSGNLFSTHPTLEQRLAALKSGEYQQLLDHARGRRARRAETLAAIAAGLAPVPGKIAAHTLTAFYAVKDRLPETYSIEKTREPVGRATEMLAGIAAELARVPWKIAAYVPTAFYAIKDRLPGFPSLMRVLKLTVGALGLVAASVGTVLLWDAARNSHVALDSAKVPEPPFWEFTGGGETIVSKTLVPQHELPRTNIAKKQAKLKADTGRADAHRNPKAPATTKLP